MSVGNACDQGIRRGEERAKRRQQPGEMPVGGRSHTGGEAEQLRPPRRRRTPSQGTPTICRTQTGTWLPTKRPPGKAKRSVCVRKTCLKHDTPEVGFPRSAIIRANLRQVCFSPGPNPPFQLVENHHRTNSSNCAFANPLKNKHIPDLAFGMALA